MKRFIITSIILLTALPAFASSPSISVTADPTVSNKFVRHTVTGITTPLPQSPDVPGFLGVSFLAVGDLDNNSTLDIVCASGEGQDVNYMTNNGEIAVFDRNGTNLDNWTQGIVNNTFAFPNDPLLHDMDGDGDLDILIGDNFVFGFVTGFSAGIYWLENKGGTITNPLNWEKHTIYEGGITAVGQAGLMHVAVLDVDGDGKDDVITSRVDLGTWQGSAPKPPPTPPPASEPQVTFMEIFKKEATGFMQTDADGTPSGGGTCYGYSRHVIGDGGGFQFNLGDIDGDGDLDIYAPQYLTTYGSSLIMRPDIHGDSLCWFENPGRSSAALNPWNRYTAFNDNTPCASQDKLGRGFIVIEADLDNDGASELIYSTNNHQGYLATDPLHRLWPSGVYLLEIPAAPKVPANWCPITIETGDPLLDPTNATAVANDLYACDRRGSPLQTGSPGYISVGDINKDEYLDLLVAGDNKGAIYYYESAGSTSSQLKFKRASLYVDPGIVTGGNAIIDIDKDGDLDIVHGIYDTSVLQPGNPGYVELKSSSIFVYENTTATTTTTTATTPTTTTTTVPPAAQCADQYASGEPYILYAGSNQNCPFSDWGLVNYFQHIIPFPNGNIEYYATVNLNGATGCIDLRVVIENNYGAAQYFNNVTDGQQITINVPKSYFDNTNFAGCSSNWFVHTADIGWQFQPCGGGWSGGSNIISAPKPGCNLNLNTCCPDVNCCTPTAINLSSFTAAACDEAVMLKWETETENNNFGFNIYRAESEDGVFVKINGDIIPTKGSTTNGASYQLTDTDVQKGKAYYYLLKDFDENGAENTSGQVNVKVRRFHKKCDKIIGSD